MFGLFKKKSQIQKSCTNCVHYSCFHESDKLNKDKTVTKGTWFIQSCRRMDALLHDTQPCPMYSHTDKFPSSGHALRTVKRERERAKEL